MTNLGIKNVTHKNWLHPDPLMHSLMMPDEEWVVSILKPELKNIVPLEIRKLFEVTRCSMLYGYFFYPLFTLAYEQLLRVAETAISKKCKQITVEKIGRNRLIDKLKYLKNTNNLTDEEFLQWNLLRELRNIASHPDQQTILPPGISLRFLSDISELINALFSPKTY